MNKSKKFVTIIAIILVLMIIGMVLFIILSGTKYDGEYFEQDKDNPTLYYVYMHETKNPQNRYKVETQSQIMAKQLSELKDTKLHFKDRYMIFGTSNLPYERIEDDES